MISHRSLVACVASYCAVALCDPHSHKDPPLHQSAIPSPKSVLGFTPGDDRTIAGWSQITDYFERLDRASDRVLVQNSGPIDAEATTDRRLHQRA